MLMDRRAALRAIGLAVAAPVIVRAASLMPVKTEWREWVWLPAYQDETGTAFQPIYRDELPREWIGMAFTARYRQPHPGDLIYWQARSSSLSRM